MTPEDLRKERIITQSVNPFGENFPSTLRTTSIVDNVPNSAGNELHHNRILGVYDPFFSDNRVENLAMIDHLYQRGVAMGNSILNLTAQPDYDHTEGDDTIHRFARENNIELNKVGIQNTPDDGTGYEYIESVRNKISALPYEERLKALDVFVDEIQPALDQKMSSMGYTQPSRKEVADEWTRSVNAEHDEIVRKHKLRQIEKKLDINPSAEAFKKKYITQLLRKL